MTTETNAYLQRKANLAKIGFSDYFQYLRSDLWAAIRRRVFQEIGSTCKGCHADATEVHHRNYSEHVLLGWVLVGLVPLCKQCHLYVEYYKDGIKVPTLEIANSRLDDLLKTRFDSVDRPASARLKQVYEDLVKIQGVVNALHAKLKKSKHGGAIIGLKGQVGNAIDRLMKE